MSKVVGIKFKQKSKDNKYHDKIYYYRTDRDVSKGEKLNIKVPSGGSPDAVVVSIEEKSKRKRLKKLEVE